MVSACSIAEVSRSWGFLSTTIWKGCCNLQVSTSLCNLAMNVFRPVWVWKLAMSRLVIRSITLTALVTKVMCSNSLLGHWITLRRLSIMPQDTSASPPAS